MKNFVRSCQKTSCLYSVGFAVIILLCIVLVACLKFPEPKEDDEGYASFAHQVIPTLLGRKPYGVDEVEVVADIAQLHGRSTAVEMLMRDQAFVDHWADVLIDLLNVQRERTGGINVAQDSSCWGEPTREVADPSIAEWIRDHAPGDPGAPTPEWNMTDLMRSAIALDDLSPLYRANLFTMSMRRAGSANGRRDEITQHFLHTYLNRDITCLRCHNPTYSASNKIDNNGDIVWRRTWSILGHPEKALFGNYLDALAASSRIQYVMRGDIRQPVASGMGTKPWGMADSCVTDTSTRNPQNNGSVVFTGFKTAGGTNYPNAGFGSLDGAINPKVSVWELEQALWQGVLDLQDGYQRFPASGPLLPPDEQLYCDMTQIFSANCTGCHSGGAPSSNLDLAASDLGGELINVATQGPNSTNASRVVPNNTAQSELYRRVSAAGNPPRMPPNGGGLSAADITTIQDWINAGATTIDSSNCTASSIPDVLPDEAFAFLTASNLVDGIWMAAMGYRLTIDNGYPRNKEQRDALRNLTEYTFLSSDWSLKSVLRKILASDWMGRRAPNISQLSTAYELPLILDPWVQADPSEVPNPPAHEKANGQGELVNRYRVNTVLRNIASTLAWDKPRHFADNMYPSPLDQDLGQYLSPGLPGFDGINFQSLLALENEIGLCQKTGHSVGDNDWIDVLVSEVQNYNASHSDSPLTIGEVWSILKDRLIQDTTIEQQLPSELSSVVDAKTEEHALVALINTGLDTSLTLNSSATALSEANLNSKLREGCGVVVKTPEFLLTHVTPRGYSDNNMPDPPRLQVCMEGEPCGYPAACGKWRSVLSKMGKYTACEDRSVRKSIPIFIGPINPNLVFELVNNRYNLICPPSICGFVIMPRADDCLINLERCNEFPPIPPIDPTFSDVIGKSPVDLHQPGVLLMNANEALVLQAQGVRHRPAGKRVWQTLAPQTILRTGDQLYLPLTAALRIKTEDMEFGVDPLEQKEIEGVRAQLISITGSDAVRVVDRHFVKEGAMKVSDIIKADQAAIFETRAIKDKEWRQIIGYGAKPESFYTPTPEEVAEMNADFDALHQNMEPAKDEPTTKPPSSTRPGTHPFIPMWMYVLIGILVLVIILLLWKRKA